MFRVPSRVEAHRLKPPSIRRYRRITLEAFRRRRRPAPAPQRSVEKLIPANCVEVTLPVEVFGHVSLQKAVPWIARSTQAVKSAGYATWPSRSKGPIMAYVLQHIMHLMLSTVLCCVDCSSIGHCNSFLSGIPHKQKLRIR